MRKEFAIQLYSVRDHMEKDYVGTLEKIAGMGYTAVEFAGFGGLSAAEMKGHLDRLGLTAYATHTGFDLLSDDEKLKEQIEYHQVIGAKYMLCPWYELKTMEDVHKVAEVLNHVGEVAGKAGILTGYHNHGHEFQKVDDGAYLLDKLMEETNPETVKMELDVFWAEHAGCACIPFMKKYGSRCALVHLKQIDADKNSVDLPDGVIDMPAVVETARSFGTDKFIVEQEAYPVDSLISAAVNAGYLKAIL
ncbi:MAG TPA: sugar phosphate isomerase/epimerase [Firmicutes bacterium]|nr:sugar phosphate isomerase/epimerase [Bacillota bacterium]